MKIGKISPTIWNRSVKKKVHMDQTDGSFSWADVCVCGGHAGIGYYAVLGAAGELAARKIQAEGISVRILFPEETEEEFLADVCGEIQKGCECIKAKLTSLSAEGTAAVQTPIVYACAGGTKVQDPGMHALEETADKKTGNRQKFVKNRELLLCGYAGLEGSLRILEAAEEELSQRFINTFLMQAKKLRDQLITPEQILEAAKGRDISVWQIGSGGILAALWEMAEEEKLLMRLKNRKRNAIDEAIEVYTPYLSTVLYNMLGNRLPKEDIEEILSDVFVTLWKNADTIDLEKGTLRAYLAAVARNFALKKLNKQRDYTSLDEIELPDEAAVLEENTADSVVWDAVMSLGEPDNEIFVRYYKFGEKIREIAKATGVNPSTVKTKLSRGKRKLKEILLHAEGLL